jgi:hypothetical protein
MVDNKEGLLKLVKYGVNYFFPPMLLFLLGLSWAFASPIGSAADDHFHLSSIWCAKGENNLCNDGPNEDTQLVARVLATWPPCYVKWPSSFKSAICLSEIELPLQLIEINKVYLNSPGNYPPLFYEVMKIFASDNPYSSIHIMRIINTLIASFLLFLALLVSPFIIKRALIVSWGIAVIPVGIFYIASTNPSSWAISSLGTFWAFILAIIYQRKRNNKLLVVAIIGASITLLLSLGSRRDSVIYLTISLIAIFIITFNKEIFINKSKRFYLSTSILIALLSFYLFSFVSRNLIGGIGLRFPGAQSTNDQPNSLVNLLLDFPSFIVALFGGQSPYKDQFRGDLSKNFSYGISWSDFSLPTVTGISIFTSFIILIFASLNKASVKKMLSVTTIFTTLVLIVILTKGSSGVSIHAFNDIHFQPRYFIPGLLILTGFSLIKSGKSKSLLNPLPSAIVTTFLIIGGSFAWLATISRFSLGPNSAFTNFWKDPLWWSLPETVTRLEFFVVTFFVTALWYISTILLWSLRLDKSKSIFLEMN